MRLDLILFLILKYILLYALHHCFVQKLRAAPLLNWKLNRFPSSNPCTSEMWLPILLLPLMQLFRLLTYVRNAAVCVKSTRMTRKKFSAVNAIPSWSPELPKNNTKEWRSEYTNFIRIILYVLAENWPANEAKKLTDAFCEYGQNW